MSVNTGEVEIRKLNEDHYADIFNNVWLYRVYDENDEPTDKCSVSVRYYYRFPNSIFEPGKGNIIRSAVSLETALRLAKAAHTFELMSDVLMDLWNTELDPVSWESGVSPILREKSGL